ncbi:MAG: MFS transporter [Erythrobacter sp.]|jgi:Na+/melibiose symporter-like transporter|nr:MFS transporter [Erythrobacter sp.]
MRDLPQGAGTTRLGAVGLIALSLPSMLFAGFDIARRSYLPLFLTDGFGTTMTTAALVMALTGLWGVAMEFGASVLGDHSPTGWGPRRLWIGLGTFGIFGATGAMLLIYGAGPGGGLWCLVALMLALIASWTVCNVTHGAWALEAGGSARQRAGIFGLRGFFAISGATGFALLAAVMTGGQALAGIAPFIAIIAVTGLGIPLLHGLLVAFVPCSAVPRAEPEGVRILAPLLILVANPRHRRLALLFGLVGLHAGIGGSTFLITARAGFGLGSAADLVLGVSTASAALGALVSARWGAACLNERALTLLMMLKLALALALLAIPPGDPVVLAGWALVGGLFATLHLLVLRLLLGECLDRPTSTKPQGPGRGALFYAAFHIPLNIGLAAGAGLALAALGWAGIETTANRVEQVSYLAVLVPAFLLSFASLAGIFAVHGVDRLFRINSRDLAAFSKHPQ